MSGDFQIRVNKDSLAQLRANLESLSKSTEKKIVTKALYKAATLMTGAIREEIRSQGLIYTGNMVRSIGVSGKKLPKGKVGLTIGILKWDGAIAVGLFQGKDGLEGVDRSAFYARFIESGSKYIFARHFMQKAAASSAGALVDSFIDHAAEYFEIEAAKLPK